MPLISIIMACHNAEPYVAAAIQSALHQSFTNFEIVFVDDCSSDRSLELATKFSLLDSRVRVFKTNNQSGAGIARNYAIDNSRGEWLSVLDSDDIFLPDKLERQMELVRNYDSNLVLIGSGSYQINEKGLRINQYTYPGHMDFLKRNLESGRKFPPHSSIVYRSSVVKKIGGFNHRFQLSEDYDLWLRLSELGNFACHSLPLIEYRVHSTNISKSTTHGHSQIVYGIAAGICHRLRKAGYKDPSALDDKAQFDILLDHVSKTILFSGHHDYLLWKTNLKKELCCSHSNFCCFKILLKAILNHPSSIKHYIKDKDIFLKNIVELCYLSWVRKVI
jgi:teichuronic acid biosynthesis glycosyltransferase TuaG